MTEETNSGNAYDIVLADLKAKRAQIDAAIAAIESMKGVISSVEQPVTREQSSQVTPSVTAGDFHGMNIADAAKQLLSKGKKPLGTQEITKGIIEGGIVFSTETPANTVNSVLHRRAGKDGDIIRVGRSLWGLAAWYPNPGRFQKKSRPSISDNVQTLLEGVARDFAAHKDTSPQEVLDSWELSQEMPESIDRRMLPAARDTLGRPLSDPEKEYMRERFIDLIRERNS